MSLTENEPSGSMEYNAHALYNQAGADVDAIYRLKKAYHRRNILSRIAGHIPPGEAIRMLEFGPGLGCTIELVKENYPSVDYHLIDIDGDQLERLREKYPDVSPHCVARLSELEALTGQISPFDVIVAVDVWEHLPLAEVVGYTAWCLRHLVPSGMLILQVPNWGCPVTPHAVYAGDLTHYVHFNEHSARQLLNMAGAHSDEVEICGRMSPGLAGAIRDALRSVFFLVYRLMYVLMGTVRLRILEPDLLMVVRKRSS